MQTSRKRREHEAAPETARPQAPVRAPSPAEQVLALQRTAGNQAVARSLAVARDAKAPPKPEEKGEERKSTVSIEISGLGTIDLESLQMEGPRGPGAGGQGRRRPGEREGEQKPRMAVNATMRMNDKASELHRAMLSGKPFETVVIRIGTLTVTMKNAMLTSVSVSGGGEGPGEERMSFSLEGEEPEFKQEKPDEGS
jgi:hypothetical protein